MSISTRSRGLFAKTIAVCSLSVLSTQAYSQNGFEFGIRYLVTKSVLFNNSDKNAGPELDQASTMSFLSGGLAAGYKINKHIGVEVDILYVRQGQKYTGVNMTVTNNTAYNSEVAMQAYLNDVLTTGSYKARAELNCIKIPVLLNLATNNTKRLYYTLSAGPQINIVKTAVFEIDGEDVLLPGLNIEPNDVYRKVTIDGVLALGAGFNLSKHFSLTAQLRFDYGFQDVEQKNATFTYMGSAETKFYDKDRSATHNGTAALMVGVNYKL